MKINPGAKLILTQTVAVQREGYPGNVLLILEKGEQGYVGKPTPEGVVSDLKEYGGVNLTGIFRSEGPETEGQDPSEVRVIVPVEDWKQYFEAYDDTYNVGEEFIIIEPLPMKSPAANGNQTQFTHAQTGETVRVTAVVTEHFDDPRILLELQDRTSSNGTYVTGLAQSELHRYIERLADDN